MPKFIIINLIKLYQKTLSLDHGPLREVYPYHGCRFRPTCSEYTLEAVRIYGALKGMWLGTKRIVKCHPFSKGGWYPLE